jgi:hypothetical protein
MIEFGFIVARFATSLIHELDTKFPTHAIMDVLGIVYSQYWFHLDANVSFKKHLEVLKVALYCGKNSTLNGQEVQVLELFNAGDLECQ